MDHPSPNIPLISPYSYIENTHIVLSDYPTNHNKTIPTNTNYFEERPSNFGFNQKYPDPNFKYILPSPNPSKTGPEKEDKLEENYLFSQMVIPTMFPPSYYMMTPENYAAMNENIFQVCQQSQSVGQEYYKKIGKLTPEERFIKIAHYKQKRNRRIFSKRINYQCRKRVADQRIRIQGRFVAKKDAIELMKNIGLDESDLNNEVHHVNSLLNNPSVKNMLKNRLYSKKKPIFKTKQVDNVLLL